jgi:hypothetical protein
MREPRDIIIGQVVRDKLDQFRWSIMYAGATAKAKL